MPSPKVLPDRAVFDSQLQGMISKNIADFLRKG